MENITVIGIRKSRILINMLLGVALPLCQIVCQKNYLIKKSAEKHSFLCLLRVYLRVIER